MVVLTYETNYEFSFVKDLRKKLPSSSILTVGRRGQDSVYKALRSEPFLTDSWYCILNYPDAGEKILKRILDSKENHLIIRVTSKEDLEEARSLLSVLHTEYSFIDNSDISDEDKFSYITSHINCKNDSVTQKIIKLSPSTNMLIQNVTILSTLEVVTLNDVKSYCSKYADLSYYSVLGYLCGTSKVSYSKVAKFIHDNVYSYRHLIKFLIKNLEMYVYVYNDIELGLLSFDNIRQYKDSQSNIKDSKVKGVSDNQIKRILYLHENLSYDKLLYMLLEIERSKNKGVYYLLSVLKMGGMSND